MLGIAFGFGLGMELDISQSPLSSYRFNQIDTFDISSELRRACRAVLFDKLGTTKMHWLDTLNVWRRDEPSKICAYSISVNIRTRVRNNLNHSGFQPREWGQ